MSKSENFDDHLMTIWFERKMAATNQLRYSFDFEEKAVSTFNFY